jgi:hypothetical protein
MHEKLGNELKGIRQALTNLEIQTSTAKKSRRTFELELNFVDGSFRTSSLTFQGVTLHFSASNSLKFLFIHITAVDAPNEMDALELSMSRKNESVWSEPATKLIKVVDLGVSGFRDFFDASTKRNTLLRGTLEAK